MEFDALRQCPKISLEIYSCCPQVFLSRILSASVITTKKKIGG